MKRLQCISSAVLLCACPGWALAADGDGLAAKFAARESIRDLSLSPDGSKVLVVGPTKEGGEAAVVITVGGDKIVPILVSKGHGEKVSGCQFVIETRVVCGIALRRGSNSTVESMTRLLTIAADGSDMKQLSARTSSNADYVSNYGGRIIDYAVDGRPGTVLMDTWQASETTTATLTGKITQGLGVDAVDVTTLARRQVETPRKSAIGYLGDGHGHIRVMALQAVRSSGYREDEVVFKARPAIDGSWQDLSTVTIDAGMQSGFEPIAVDAAANVAYGFQAHDGFTALMKQSLAGSAPEVVLAKDGIDVDGLLRIGPQQRVIGATYATDKRTAEYFDPELKQLVAALSGALGGKDVQIVDATSDEKKLVVYAGSDVDPGTYYLFDKATKQLGIIGPARPELAGVRLAPMKSVTYPGPDGTPIPAYLTLPLTSQGKKVPAIVMPHGGPSARDEWGFDWLVQFFAARGYAVLQPNYRGSAGYGTAWFDKNGFRSWPTAIGDINAAGRWLVSSGVTTADKLAIVGWSYGGYAALQSAVVDPDLFKAIVAIAPVTDLDRIKQESTGFANHLQVEDMVGTGPHIESGSPARHADKFKAPVLLIHGDADMNVAVGESRLMEERLKGAGKQVTYIEFPDLAHSLDDAAARQRLLEESDRMLRKALSID